MEDWNGSTVSANAVALQAIQSELRDAIADIRLAKSELPNFLSGQSAEALRGALARQEERLTRSLSAIQMIARGEYMQ